MSNVETTSSASAVAPAQPTHTTQALWLQALGWVGAPIVVAPFAVLLHELGHRVAHMILGFQGSALHYSSTTYDLERAFWQQAYRGDFQAAAAIIPPRYVATSTAAGILVTFAVVIICCYVAARYRPHPLVVALGVVSPVRFLSGLPTLATWFSGKPIRSASDEVNLAVLTGLPIVLLIGLGLLVLFGAWFWMIRCIPKQQRLVAAGGLLVGTVAGLVLYLRYVGPLLLP